MHPLVEAQCGTNGQHGRSQCQESDGQRLPESPVDPIVRQHRHENDQKQHDQIAADLKNRELVKVMVEYFDH